MCLERRRTLASRKSSEKCLKYLVRNKKKGVRIPRPFASPSSTASPGLFSSPAVKSTATATPTLERVTKLRNEKLLKPHFFWGGVHDFLGNHTAEDGEFELPPAYLHTNTRSCLGQYFAAFDPMFLGVHRTHVSWIPKFPTHESAHDPLRRALPLRIALELVPDFRNSPVWGNFGDTFFGNKYPRTPEDAGSTDRPNPKIGLF